MKDLLSPFMEFVCITSGAVCGVCVVCVCGVWCVWCVCGVCDDKFEAHKDNIELRYMGWGGAMRCGIWDGEELR